MSNKWNPEQYEKFKNERTQPFMDLMKLVQPGSLHNAIDLGCGTGELTKVLHDHLKLDSTIGIDSSSEMLEKAQLFISPGLSFHQSNIETWKSDTQYDLIFSNAALQWCENHPQLFKTIFDSLKSNGQMAVQMPLNHDYPTHTLAAGMSSEPHWNNLLNGKTYKKYDQLLSMEEYAHLLFKLGFKEQQVNVKVYGHVLDSRDEVVEWVKGSMLTYFKSHLSEDDYKAFVDEFRQRLFKILPDEKPFFYPFKRLTLWARK